MDERIKTGALVSCIKSTGGFISHLGDRSKGKIIQVTEYLAYIVNLTNGGMAIVYLPNFSKHFKFV